MAKEMQFKKEAEFHICQVSMSCVTDIKYNSWYFKLRRKKLNKMYLTPLLHSPSFLVFSDVLREYKKGTFGSNWSTLLYNCQTHAFNQQ